MHYPAHTQILSWAYQKYLTDLWVAISFGKDSLVITGLLRDMGVLSKVNFLWINTGYDFDATIEFKNMINEKWHLRLHEITPKHTVEEFEREYGTELYLTDPSLCCRINKVRPLAAFLEEHQVECWVSGLRRDESPSRKNTEVVEVEHNGQRIKVNPLIRWTHEDIWKYLKDNNIPYNPLYDQDYRSLGCKPCSDAGVVGRFEDTEERKGRWLGTDKEGGECGIHTEL